jgi:hypothetical protein
MHEHAIKAETLRYAASEISKSINSKVPRLQPGMRAAVRKLRQLAALHHNAHLKQLDIQKQQARNYNLKSEAFGFPPAINRDDRILSRDPRGK